MTLMLDCDDDDRRRAVRMAGTVNGIDFIEVADAAQTVLEVTFLHPLPGEAGGVPAAPPLGVANLRLSGGVRIRAVRILAVDQPRPNVLALTVDQPGDFSVYTLSVVAGAGGDAPPPGFDPSLSRATFSFKAACPVDLPCATPPACVPTPGAAPVIDYLAKDYESFRAAMLARLRQLMPDWQDASPADPYLALVETLAYAADRLSYMQDAAGTEAYLSTARSRISVARHTRLIDYPLHAGANARTFVAFEVGAAADGRALGPGTPIFSRQPGVPAEADAAALAKALKAGAVGFALMTAVTLHARNSRIAFHTWSRRDCCLPRGSTAVTLAGAPVLQPGDFLVLEQIASPQTGADADADPDLTHVVRLTDATAGTDPLDGAPIVEVAWADADALPFDLPLAGGVGEGGAEAVLARARANVALADHGIWMPAPLDPQTMPADGSYRPCIAVPGVTRAAPFTPGGSATAALKTDPRVAVPAIRLVDASGPWVMQQDLLASDRFANDAVAELDDAGFTRLRFGDDVNGRHPAPLSRFAANARFGTGARGNVGRGALAHVVSGWGGPPVEGILAVDNPLPGSGGAEPERPARARLFAPPSIREQKRAVTAADWAAWARTHPRVQRAAADLRWTGSWYTVFLTLDLVGGGRIDAEPGLRAALLAHLGAARLAGYDLELRDPIFLPLHLVLRVCAARDHAGADIRARLMARFSSGIAADGRQGVFHPDAFSFGDPVYLSRVVAAAMAVGGVGSVAVETFQRWGGSANGEVAAGVLRPGAREIVQLENDPNFPERGVFEVVVEGAL